MKTLILGGAGFIGRHLVNRLTEDKHDVSVLDLSPNPLSSVNSFVGHHDDRQLLNDALSDCDIVYHLVSTTVPATANQDVEFDIASNLISTVRLLDAMRLHNVNRIVFLSSGGAVYGNPRCYPVPEDHPLDPISSYGIVKVAIEKYLFMYQELYGLQPLIIRPSNAYGPGQNLAKPQGVIGHFLATALKGEPVSIWGDGSVRRDFIYVDDLVELIATAGGSEVSGVFNAGAGTDASVLEIVSILENLLGKEMPKKHLAARPYDVSKVRLDISLAAEAFGWVPRVGLTEGVRRQFESLDAAMFESVLQTHPA